MQFGFYGIFEGVESAGESFHDEVLGECEEGVGGELDELLVIHEGVPDGLQQSSLLIVSQSAALHSLLHFTEDALFFLLQIVLDLPNLIQTVVRIFLSLLLGCCFFLLLLLFSLHFLQFGLSLFFA